MKTTTTITTATELLNITIDIKNLQKEQLLKANELSTNYLSELYSITKDITIEKDKFRIIRNFKSNLLESISDTDKVLNTVLITLNKALKNSDDKTLNILKLCDFSIVAKFSKLSNSNQKVIISEGFKKVDFERRVHELLKSQNKELRIKDAKKLLNNNGYKVN